MKRIISFIMSILLVSAISISAFAAEVYDEDAGAYIGPVIKFEGSDSMQNGQGALPHLNSAKSTYARGDLICNWETGSIAVPGTVQYYAYYYSSQKINQEFEKYLTASWAKAESYTWSKSNTVSYSVSGDIQKEFAKKIVAKVGLNLSHTTTYSVAVTIPANSSRYSKLGFASDYTRVNFDYKVDHIMSGETTTTREYVKCPEEDTYLIVYYK